MLKEIDLGFMIDDMRPEEIHGVGEGLTKEWSDEYDGI